MAETYSNSDLVSILGDVKTIALVGASAKPERPSNGVMRFLQTQGYRVIPINPGLAGQEIHGEKVYASLADAPGPYDMVDIFRNSEAALGVTQEAIALKDEKDISTVWMQLGVINDEAEALAREAGLNVVMDHCPQIVLTRAGDGD